MGHHSLRQYSLHVSYRWTLIQWKKVSFSTKATQDLLSNLSFSFLGKRKVAYIVSGVFILLSLGSLSFNGLNQGVDFVGGRSYTVRFDQIMNPSEVEKGLVDTFGSAEVKTFGEDNQLKITTKYKIEEEGSALIKKYTISCIHLCKAIYLMGTLSMHL